MYIYHYYAKLERAHHGHIYSEGLFEAENKILNASDLANLRAGVMESAKVKKIGEVKQAMIQSLSYLGERKD